MQAADWNLIGRWVGAIAAVATALAGWVAFFLQRRNLQRLRETDLTAWDEEFVRYRRQGLKPLAETIRLAYGSFIEGQKVAPSTWEEGVHAARWPRDVPMPDTAALQLWRTRFGVGLDAEDEFLFRFCEAIYPPFNSLDKRLLRERSILQPEEFDLFDRARGDVADYFERCGQRIQQSKQFAKFLEEKVRPNHYFKVKLVAYLELALARAWGEASETAPGKMGLFSLGKKWESDDKRAAH
jgi:hypothetical protein